MFARLNVHRLLFSLLLLLLFCGMVWHSPASARQQTPDMSSLFEGIDLRPADSAFIAPPREVIRPLVRCKKLIIAGDVSDAVEILGEVLADDTVEDFLISRGSRYFESLRSRTELILGSIDESYLEAYRIRYRIRARKLLDQGIAESDPSLLKKVSNQFFFTESGSEATMLLGHMELSRGQPSAAQSWFAKVVRFPATAKIHDPEASILLAMCQILGNNNKRAEATLVSLKQRMPNSAIAFQGKDYTLFNRNEDALPWLTSLIGDSPLASNRKFSEWLMFGGNPSRTGKSGTGMPLLLPRWEHATGASLALQKESSEFVEKLVQDNEAPAPAVQPLVVGETIVYRDVDRMYGIDFETGRKQWAWPPQMAWNIKPNREISNAKKAKMKQRLIIDSIYGQASSDGKLIFFIPSPGSSSQSEYDNAFQDAARSDPEDRRVYNELVAIDSENAGLLSWRVGGPTGLDEPKLAKAYFIGEPLPLEGVLYCCCVKGNAVQLLAIDAKTGKLRWTQSIANYDRESFDANYFRRLAGVSPSYADGKIVCMTGTGAVVALEVSTRTLLWGHEYRPPSQSRVISEEKTYPNALTDAWRDSQVTIADGLVFLTPVLSREMICLSLDTGNLVWFEDDGLVPRRVDRKSSLYLAGLHRDKLILVGAEDVRAIESQSGRESWSLELATGDLLSGRGYIGDGSLFLPTASRKILRIDLETGKIAESVGTNRILGNLSRVRGDVISHGIDHVASYPEYKASKKSFEGLEPNELDEQQSFVRAQTLIQQGDQKEGLNLLIDLAGKNPKDDYAAILTSCANNFQVDEPALSLKAHAAIKEFFPDQDVSALERTKMLTKLRIGEYEESIQLGLQQLETDFAEMQTKEDPGYSGAVTQRLAASLLDVASANDVGDIEIEGIDIVDFDNSKHAMRYSTFGWERAKLLLAMEGLEQSRPEAVQQYSDRIAKLVSDNLEKDDALVEWILARLHERIIDTSTLESISRRYLKKEKFLAALHYINAAIRKTEKRESLESDQLKLLKAQILFAGRDTGAAKIVLDTINASEFEESQRSAFAELGENVAAKLQSEKRGLNATTNNESEQGWLPHTAIVKATPEKKAQTPLRYRLPVDYDTGTPDRYRSMRIFYCPWGKKEKEFELRDRNGSIVQVLRVRDRDDNKSFGYTRACSIDIQNHVAEFTLNKLTYVIDWFQVLAGEDGNLWRFPQEQVTKIKTAFTGRNEIIYAHGTWLYCFDTLTGKNVWRRNLNRQINRIVAHDDLVTTWTEGNRQFNTLDAATGQLKRTFKSGRYFVKRSLTDKFLMYYPIRKGELPEKEEAALVGPDGPKNPAKVAEHFAVFDPRAGKLVWQRVMNPRSSRYYKENFVCILAPDGALTFLDLQNGDVISELELPLSETDRRSIEGMNLAHHRAGWIIQVRCKDRSDRFSRGKSRYRYKLLHRKLASGPVFLVDESKKNLLWKSPIYLEQMEYMANQPTNSPAILFGRHILRYSPGNAEANFMQTLILDAKDGSIIGSEIVKTLENYSGHAIEWTKAENPLERKLVISTATEIAKFELSEDTEKPPVPNTRITFNAMGFFDDPVFEKPQASVADTRVDDFQEKAVAADKVRQEKQAEAAADLRKKMGIGGRPQD